MQTDRQDGGNKALNLGMKMSRIPGDYASLTNSSQFPTIRLVHKLGGLGGGAAFIIMSHKWVCGFN